MKNLKFTCPKCGEHNLEEIQVDVVSTHQIKSINRDGEIKYGKTDNEGGEVSHYQCANCGAGIESEHGFDMTDSGELAEWIKENCPPQ